MELNGKVFEHMRHEAHTYRKTGSIKARRRMENLVRLVAGQHVAVGAIARQTRLPEDQVRRMLARSHS